MPPNNGHAGSTQSAVEANGIEKRRTEVAPLVLAHFSYRQIAERLGVAPSTISEDVKAMREQWRQRSSADYGTFLAEETAKLDLLERELLPEALHGGPEGGLNLQAVDRLLAIRDRRARMLGLDSPSRVEVTMSHVPRRGLHRGWRRDRWLGGREGPGCLQSVADRPLSPPSTRPAVALALVKGSRRSDSNRRPADYKSAALPAELLRRRVKG
jgi:hypothetical protein